MGAGVGVGAGMASSDMAEKLKGLPRGKSLFFKEIFIFVFTK
jgi:hypothetical protein